MDWGPQNIKAGKAEPGFLWFKNPNSPSTRLVQPYGSDDRELGESPNFTKPVLHTNKTNPLSWDLRFQPDDSSFPFGIS